MLRCGGHLSQTVFPQQSLRLYPEHSFYRFAAVLKLPNALGFRKDIDIGLMAPRQTQHDIQ